MSIQLVHWDAFALNESKTINLKLIFNYSSDRDAAFAEVIQQLKTAFPGESDPRPIDAVIGFLERMKVLDNDAT